MFGTALEERLRSPTASSSTLRGGPAAKRAWTDRNMI
jgi:hypothetical protein